MTKEHGGFWDIWKNLFFPRRCTFCRKLLPLKASQSICTDCMNKLPFTLVHHRCRRCGRPVLAGEKLCHHCRGDVKPAYLGISAPYLYAEPVRSAMLRFKRERYQGYAQIFAEHMRILLFHDCPGRVFDWVVSAPPRGQRMRKEGYDQAAHLGKTLAKKMGIPYLPSALCQKETREKQSSLLREKRFDNIAGNIKVIKPKAVAGKRILLVDDVTTTGATLKEAAKMLRKAGAKEVYCATAAIVE